VHDSARQRLLFTVTSITTTERDRELVQGFMERLAETYPDPRPEYLGQAMGVPRDALAEMIDVDELPQATSRTPPLLDALRLFGEADTWSASYLVVQEHPELLGEEADSLLVEIALAQSGEGARQTIEEHRVFLRRCREVGVEAAYAEKRSAIHDAKQAAVPPELAQDLRQASEAEAQFSHTSDIVALDAACAAWGRIWAHPAFESAALAFRLASLNDGAVSFLSRYWYTRNVRNLEVALSKWEEAVTAAPPGSPEKASILGNLGNGLLARYGRSGELPDLERAIAANVDAVAATPPGSPDRPRHLENLGDGLRARYGRIGELPDLERAIAAFEEAVAATPSCSRDRPGYLNTMGLGLFARYGRSGELPDLERAIAAFEDAVAVTPPDSAERPNSLGNLGTGLRARYGRTGELADLERAIAAYEGAVAASPPGSPVRPSRLNNLGNGMSNRYGRTGELADLERAIVLYEEAAAATPPSSPEKAATLINLGSGLRDRYERSGELSDLERAIAAFEEALKATPPGSPERPGSLNNLGRGLRDRYGRTGALADIERAIAAFEEAVAATPPSSSEKASMLNNLGTGLWDRFGRSGELPDLERAIAVFEEAVAATPPGSPERPSRLNNLGLGLSIRYGRTSALPDLERAIAAFEQGCQLGLIIATAQALHSAQNWATWATQRAAWPEAARAHAYALQAVDGLFDAQSLRADKETYLREVRGLHARAAYAMAMAGDPVSAVTALETGRARILGQALERDRADLGRLEQKDASLCQRFLLAAQRLRALEAGEIDRQILLAPGQTLADTMRQARDSLNAIATEIRGIEGFEMFLARPTFEQIQSIAESGHPLVYLTTTDLGTLALIVFADQVPQALWLEPTTSQLAEALARSDATHGGYLGAYHEWRVRPSESSARAWFRALQTMLTWLSESLMTPLCQELTERGCTRSVLVPSGFLGLLPLHAAGNGVTFSIAPSALALSKARDRAAERAPASILAVDNPNPVGQYNLLFSADEVLAAMETFALGERSHLAGCEATVEAVFAAMPSHSVWHFSTHGLAGWPDPMASSLLLADFREINMRDLQRLQCSARLAVLSACETGLHDLDLPDEVVSLPSSLLQVGAAGVVASLWSVGEFSTALLMIRFYEAWRVERHEPPEALAEAQEWLRQSTKAQLIGYFRRSVPELDAHAHVGHAIPAQVARHLYGRIVLMDNDDECRPFAHPFYWAAFCYTGV
jgi:CHAT domain-containing protein/tetratricopeptide (TPR) repeat protein